LSTEADRRRPAHASLGLLPAIAQTRAMSSRRAHQLAILRDTDALHALGIAGGALLLSGGLVYLAYVLHVWRVARSSPAMPPAASRDRIVLLFGKRCRGDQPDRDFQHRIGRAHQLVTTGQAGTLLLLGGGPSPTEAEIAQRALQSAGLPSGTRLILEHDSRDTLQNLRNARRLLAVDLTQGQSLPAREDGREAVLLSSRYHLARCALFARHLGMPHQLCAAEAAWSWSLPSAGRLLSEAGYLMWLDIGARWARLIGHRRMLEKIS